MHLSWDISIGQLVLSAPVLVLAGYIVKIYNMLTELRMEHEMLMDFWAKSQKPPRNLNDLPWRRGYGRGRQHK